MEVIKVSPRGYCYGVVDALQVVQQAIQPHLGVLRQSALSGRSTGVTRLLFHRSAACAGAVSPS